MQIRHDLKPGDTGHLIHLHGTLYSREYGYDNTFEAYVARGLADFVLNHNPEKERIWIAEDEGKIIGSVTIVRVTEEEAQLRWYFVLPEYRGKGLGQKLIGETVDFCRSIGYKSIILWTTSELKAAAHLYKKEGFVKTEEKTHVIWGSERTEEKYMLII